MPPGPEMDEIITANKNFQDELEQRMKDIARLMEELEEAKNKEKLAQKKIDLLEREKGDLIGDRKKAEQDLEDKMKELNDAKKRIGELEKEVGEQKSLMEDKAKKNNLITI